jgi:hypothetical protein
MVDRLLTPVAVAAALAVFLPFGALPAAAQVKDTAQSSVEKAPLGSAPRKAAPRTPWGDPDVQGVWTGSTLTPLERPRELAAKEFLTETEAAALERRAAEGRVDAPPRPGDPGTYNQIWFDPGTKVVPSRRTSLVIDPPDGRIPFTPHGRAHTTASAVRYGVGPFTSHLDLDTGERCLTDGVPIWFSGYNNNYQIFQTPEYVVIVHELYRELRVIPLNTGPRRSIPQWQGEGRGRWEGPTLVVETTNFADKSAYWWTTAWRASRPTLRVVERFTRVDAETIDYQFTMEDPVMFTRPWTAAFPLTTNQAARGVTKGPLYEYACHEGNYAMVNVLTGARAAEQGSGSRATTGSR